MERNTPIVLGADAGTHGIRILAISYPDGAILRRSNCPYERTIGEGVQSIDADTLEQTFLCALGKLTLKDSERVLGIGITHQRGTVIPVDSACLPLAAGFCDSDERSADADSYRECGIDPKQYYRKSGCPVVSFNGFSKVLWCRKNQGELYRNTAAWLSPQDYLLSKLCGSLVLTEGSALRSGILDVEKRTLWQDVLPDAPWRKDYCIPVGTQCGTTGERYASMFPALEGAALIAVPGDQPAAVIGCGGLGEREFAMNLGTTFVASGYSRQAVHDPDELITTEVLPDGIYSPEFGTGAGGQYMDFLTRLLYGEARTDAETWKEINASAMEAPAGACGLRTVPLLWQVTSSGVWGGISGFSPVQTRAHVIRSAFEGLAYEAKLSVRHLEKSLGESESLTVFGGLSGSPAFLTILASVLDKPVRAAEEKQASAYGAGLTCLFALGAKKDICASAPKASNVYHPDKKGKEQYEQLFREYVGAR